MAIWFSQGFNALSVGSILLLIALGLAFSFGLMNVINMAHGELIMVGRVLRLRVQQQFAHARRRASTSTSSWRCRVSFVVAAAHGRGAGARADPPPLRTPPRYAASDLGRQPHAAAGSAQHLRRPNVQVVAPTWLRSGLEVTDDLVLPYTRLFIIGLAALCIAGVYAVPDEDLRRPAHAGRHAEPRDGRRAGRDDAQRRHVHLRAQLRPGRRRRAAR